jgi:glucose-1-phosphate thymidylyltransferase
MIYYPIQTLVKAGISDILIIVAPEYSGQFLNLLGSGNELGANLSYEVQEEPRGLPDAFIVGENFIEKDNVAMILGDNIFDHNFAESVTSFKSGARIFAKQVPDPERSGVVEFDQDHKVISIVEKPEHPKSNYAVVGFYIYDNRVIEYAKSLRPSARNELEIVDLHNKYLKNGELKVDIIEGMWEDAGTFDSLLRVNNLIAERVKQGGVI